MVGALLCRTPGPGVRGRQVLTCAPRPPSLSPLPGPAHPVFAGPVALPAVSLGPAAHAPQSLLLTCGEAGSQLGGVGVSHGLPGPALSRCVSCGRAPVGSHSLGTGTRPTLSVAQPGGLRPLRDHGSSKATLPCPALHPTLCPPYSPPEANGAPHICRRLPPKEPQGLLRSPGQAVRPLLPLLPTSCFGIPAPRSARRSRAPRWAAPGRGLCGLHALPLCHWQGVGGRAVASARAWLRLEAMLL